MSTSAWHLALLMEQSIPLEEQLLRKADTPMCILVAKLSAELQSGKAIEEFVVDELLALSKELAPNKGD